MYMSRLLSRRQNVIKDFKKGFPAIDYSCRNYLFANCSGESFNRFVDWWHCIASHVYWQSESKAYYAGCWRCSNSGHFLVTVASHYYNHEDHVTKDLPAVLSFGRMPTWIKRVQDFMYADKEDASYQIQQAKIAIATRWHFWQRTGQK